MSPQRPVLRYHGGKWRLAPWITGHFPQHRCYVEPYAGAASVLLRKHRSYAEVYNDLDGEIVNVFRVLRDLRQVDELKRLLELTPYSRKEFENAYEPVDDPVEQARRTIFKSFGGFGSAAVTGISATAAGAGFRPSTGFRNNSTRSYTTPAHDWLNYPSHVASFTKRLQGVVIENRDALTVMQQMDDQTTLHYVDPPYVHDTRALKKHRTPQSYKHEMTDEDHVALAEILHGLKGMVVLSGYPSQLYAETYKGWETRDRDAHADGARDRVERLWLNPAVSDRLHLFGSAL